MRYSPAASLQAIPLWFALLLPLLILVGASVAWAGAVEDCNQVRDPERQLRGCTAYIRSHPDQPANIATALLNRANIYARRGRYAQAFIDYRRALELDPSNPLISYNLGNAYLDSGQPSLAAEAFTQALTLDQGFAFAYLNRGIARERLGDVAGAAEDFRRTLELDPTAEQAQRHLMRLRTQCTANRATPACAGLR
jgi:tetratricopeptide (TPR) repeat protein